VQNLLRIFLSAVFISGVSFTSSSKVARESDNKQLWVDCKLDGVLSFGIFNTAILGLNKLEGVKNRKIISIIDYSKPSTEKRFYVIDLEKKQLLYRSLVAHGMGSGDNMAEIFSNESDSHKSTLGFYITAETYTGKNGYSLKLDGLEKGINDNARNRDIVIHGAKYVSQDFIDRHGRIGRSWGCPALPVDVSESIIDKISGGSCLFIFGNDSSYSKNSTYYKLK